MPRPANSLSIPSENDPMIFVAPWVLIGLLALPLLWWLLRVTPPAPRSEIFPAIRFLLGLNATEETPAHTPWWLLALRLLAAGLVIVALARPVLDAGTALAGKGPVLLVDGQRLGLGERLGAPQGGRRRAAGPRRTSRPQGRPADHRPGRQRRPDRGLRHHAGRRPARPPRRDAAATLAVGPRRRSRRDARRGGTTTAPAAATTARRLGDLRAGRPDRRRRISTASPTALRDTGPVTEICCDTASAPLLLPPTSEADRLVVHLAQAPRATATQASVLAQSGDGRTLARTNITVPAGASVASGAHSASAGTAQPADPSGAGRTAQRRVRRAAG